MSIKWLQGESSLKLIQLDSPSSSFCCRLQNHDVDTLYNPTVGANLMSDEFVLALLGNITLIPTDRKLRRPSDSLVSSYGILKNVSFWHGDVKLPLNFYVFEDLNIGKDVPKSLPLRLSSRMYLSQGI